jgi:hypothetical protein
MCLRVNCNEKFEKKIFFANSKSLKKEVESGIGSGFISQRCGSASKCHASPTLLLPFFYERNRGTVGQKRILCGVHISYTWNGIKMLNLYLFARSVRDLEKRSNFAFIVFKN